MPIYEYRCQACGHELDALQKLSEAPLKTCPACEQDELVRLISAAGFRLKGSGWYETDFKSAKRRNLAGDGEGKSGDAKAAEPKAGEGKAGGKSEAKPKAEPAKSAGSAKSGGSAKSAD
ncbi:MAG TPA: zinc ribbon domain-containing protein [Gammaproteobacteria bacterium]|nr:zinc ribbon domain-containing protein [Gammaproteobacteria bacterium]